MSTDDRTETITDRAAIRDSDEPSERGDFPCCSGARAAGGAVGALDLDAIEAAALADDGWWSVPASVLVAEVRSLRAKVAAVEVVLPKHEAAVVAARRAGEVEFPVAVGSLCEQIRAALATGEGQ